MVAAILLAFWLLTPRSARPEFQLGRRAHPAIADFGSEHQTA
jgi:hypothetical protein